MNKLYKIFSLLLLAALFAVGLFSICDTDATYSESERRKLKTAPTLTLSSLLDGSFFSDFTDYYADTFPGRESLMDVNRSLNGFYYFDALDLDGAASLSWTSPPTAPNRARPSPRTSPRRPPPMRPSPPRRPRNPKSWAPSCWWVIQPLISPTLTTRRSPNMRRRSTPLPIPWAAAFPPTGCPCRTPPSSTPRKATIAAKIPRQPSSKSAGNS